MSSSAINAQLFQAKIGSIQNQADSTSVYSAGVWSFKNSTAVTSVTIDNSGNVGIGTASPAEILHLGGATNKQLRIDAADSVPMYVGGYQSTLNLSVNRRTVDGAIGNVNRSAAFISINGDSGGSFIQFATAAANNTQPPERARIDASGNFMVGMTVANETTQNGFFAGGGVKGYVAASLAGSTNGQGNTYHIYSTGAGAYRFYVGLGGTIFATSTSISAISDVSLKENVRDLETGLSQVLALKPRRFDWKEETQIDQKDVAGFIAQEVEEVLPELVYEYKYNETETKKSLKMGDMLPTLVKAIQEQQAQIEALKAEVAALKAP